MSMILNQAIDNKDLVKIRSFLSLSGPIIGRNGCIDLRVDYKIFDSIVDSRNVEIIDIFIENDPRTIPHIMNSCVRCLELLKYIIEKYNPSKFQVENTIGYAVRANNMDMVKFLVDYGVDLGEVAECAAQSGNVDLLMWCINAGSEIPEDQYLSQALVESIKSGDNHVSSFILSLSEENLTLEAVELCALNDDIESLSKLINPSINLKSILDIAISNCSREVMAFLQLISGSKL